MSETRMLGTGTQAMLVKVTVEERDLAPLTRQQGDTPLVAYIYDSANVVLGARDAATLHKAQLLLQDLGIQFTVTNPEDMRELDIRVSVAEQLFAVTIFEKPFRKALQPV